MHDGRRIEDDSISSKTNNTAVYTNINNNFNISNTHTTSTNSSNVISSNDATTLPTIISEPLLTANTSVKSKLTCSVTGVHGHEVQLVMKIPALLSSKSTLDDKETSLKIEFSFDTSRDNYEVCRYACLYLIYLQYMLIYDIM